MELQLAELIGAAVTFVGLHLALSHPLRGAVKGLVGSGGFRAVYSLLALASFAWMVIAFRAMDANAVPLWDGTKPVAWVLASAITLIAAVLLVGSFRGNPALPNPQARAMAKERPQGVMRVTRHPMMWGIALWALAHVLVSPVPRVIVLCAAIAFLALVGARLQDAKKDDQLGTAWGRWMDRTTFLPRLTRLHKAGPVALGGGVIFWVAATWMHVWLAGIPAGVWRWIG